MVQTPEAATTPPATATTALEEQSQPDPAATTATAEQTPSFQDMHSPTDDDTLNAVSTPIEPTRTNVFSSSPPSAQPQQPQPSTALFQDENGKPLFPLLYHQMRSAEANASSWQRASQQALSTASTKFQKGWQRTKSVAAEQKAYLSSVLTKAQANEKAEAKQVSTAFGTGTLLEVRESTATYVVELTFGGMLYTQDEPTPVKTTTTSTTRTVMPKKKTVLELNETFVQWEQERYAQIEQECQQLGMPFTAETKTQCFACLRQQHTAAPKATAKPAALWATATGQPLFPRLYKLRQSGAEMVQENTATLKKAVQKNTRPPTPCLLCATVCCGTHSSPAFGREHVTLCLHCVQQLEHNFTNTTSPAVLDAQVQRVADLYGRAHVLLQYCAPLLQETAAQLEQQTKQHNEIAGVGGSSVGLASGILGVAAACTIMTPVGPPLLLGSLVMGGSATAVQAGGEAYKYYSEPNQLANRVLTLQGIVDMILTKIQTMRESTLIPYLDRAVSKLEVIEQIPNMAASTTPQETKQVATRAAGTCLTSTAATSAAATLAVQEGAMAGRFVSRATTAAARTARFARFAGGALSAATLVLEARELRRTLDQMEKGNPCEKADSLRKVHGGLEKLPSVEQVRRTCRTYVKVRSRELFRQAMTADPVVATEAPDTSSVPLALATPLSETELHTAASVAVAAARPTEEHQQQEEEWQLVEEVVARLEEAQRPMSDDGSVISDISLCNVDDGSLGGSSGTRRPANKASLLQRLLRYKEREARNREEVAVDLVV